VPEVISALHKQLSAKSAAPHRVLNTHYRAEQFTGGRHGQSFLTEVVPDVLNDEVPIVNTAASNAIFAKVFFINPSP